jgi:4-diphosphocytidyl-2-C-methyl-D-erythritol kinase
MKASETLRAPAKLNLTLEILARRRDGLHGLRSVMVPIDLCDELLLEPAQRFELVCDDPDLRRDNLVERAVRALRPAPNTRVTLRKRIPCGAGMGGGSSDAAAILLAATRGVFGPLATADYVATARSLGSDVPFFLVETAALVEGTGERVTALGVVPPWHAAIVKPAAAISTAWAYEQLDLALPPSRPRNASVSLELGEALQRGQFDHVQSLLQNDFHDAVALRVPEIAAALDLLRGAGAVHPLMTGSGSCVFALTATREECDALAAEVRRRTEFPVYTAAFWSGSAWRSAA